MKRKIGLFMAVLFALTLTSQTILALDHDPFDPRYNGTVEKQLTTESDPWIDANNNGSIDRLSIVVNISAISIQTYFNIFWIGDYFKVHIILIEKKDTNLNQENISINSEVKNEKKSTDQNYPGTD
ncbi:MAG: hypothetical protein PHU88_09570 [candidate division Zixibacteria bacterium]|nr:hypothetical protein [candidate division Zixibacteria bacterium]MDD5427283.1 hypothetical protein [candidate division Zixibacteria bacterium]